MRAAFRPSAGPGGNSVARIKYRKLGGSGLTVSAITYGNWLTHSREAAEVAHAFAAA
jgi:hypothetical protein